MQRRRKGSKVYGVVVATPSGQVDVIRRAARCVAALEIVSDEVRDEAVGSVRVAAAVTFSGVRGETRC